ncbi:hypothetical protein Hypma_009716 [Hypsizygus marmoreus]|uniref:Uncharacterized protein n=1 Tax=Hypsizygus marmoreus TaxID=39966 RepID=A0A369JL43_HYPMA|nr:hypothetical protein Hypma_009716 [Hypsizygus marmoreus]
MRTPRCHPDGRLLFSRLRGTTLRRPHPKLAPNAALFDLAVVVFSSFSGEALLASERAFLSIQHIRPIPTTTFMADAPVLNTWPPMAYLSLEAGRQLRVAGYVIVGSLGAFIYDLFSNVGVEYQMLFKRKIAFPTVAYFLSRLSVLVYTILNTLLQTAPLGKHCAKVETAFCALYHVATSSTALLFLLRARAIYNRSKYAIAFFVALWLGVLGSSLTAATMGGAVSIGPTRYCQPLPLKAYIGAAPIMFAVFDTCVFLAISWRLLMDAWPDPSKQPQPKLRGIVLGKYLPEFSRALLRDGQVYYLVSVSSNIAVVVITFLEILPVTYRYLLIFNSVLTNMMACRVHRHTLFEDPWEGSIHSTHMSFALPSDAHTRNSNETSSRTALPGTPATGDGEGREPAKSRHRSKLLVGRPM